MTYDQFWLRYLRAHGRPATRLCHYAGTLLAALCLIAGILLDWRLLIAVPIVGYSFAWASHFLIERNRPETFGHPFWSLASDVRMLALWLTGRLAPHLTRAGPGLPDRG